MEDPNFEKLKILERVKKRVFCEFCKSFRYMRRVCKDLSAKPTCRYLTKKGPYKKRKHKLICKWCNIACINGYVLGGHMTNCKKNPNVIKRNQRIRDSHIGLVRSEETKEKISCGMKRYYLLRQNQNIVINKTIKISDTEIFTIRIF